MYKGILERGKIPVDKARSTHHPDPLCHSGEAGSSRTSAASSWGAEGAPESRRSNQNNITDKAGSIQTASVATPSGGITPKAWIPGPNVLAHASRNDTAAPSSDQNASIREIGVIRGQNISEIRGQSPEAFLRRHANLGGARIVAVLRSTPGQVYSPQELVCLSRGEYPTPGQLHALDLDPIPLADTRALAAYLRRRNQLRAQITAGNNNPDLAWELDFLEKELKRIGKPGGGIKNSRPERDKAYHNLMTQLWRLFRAAHKEDPRLCAWLKTRIKTGRLFAWVETT